MKIFLTLMMAACIIAIIALTVMIFNAPPLPPKVTEYKPTSTQQKNNDDQDDCSIAMCNAFGGGIVGDTLATQFMFGD